MLLANLSLILVVHRWYGVRFANAKHTDMMVNAYNDALIPDWQRPSESLLAKIDVQEPSPASTSPNSLQANDNMSVVTVFHIEHVLNKVRRWSRGQAPTQTLCSFNKHARHQLVR